MYKLLLLLFCVLCLSVKISLPSITSSVLKVIKQPATCSFNAQTQPVATWRLSYSCICWHIHECRNREVTKFIKAFFYQQKIIKEGTEI